jgi:segregation and condensation protein A
MKDDETDLDFAAAAEAGADGDAFRLDLDGFEGPLDLLLHLARMQKVDLTRISLSALVDQYLSFIEAAKALQMELAGDYVVMAAWLSLLKSRMLLPRAPTTEPGEPSPEEIAAALAHKLGRLEAARAAAARLDALPQVGRDVFLTGSQRDVAVERRPEWTGDLGELLKAYGAQRMKTLKKRAYAARPRKAYALDAARARLVDLMPDLRDWKPIQSLPPRAERAGPDAPDASSYLASVFGAALELVRDGRLEARQDGPFEELFLRVRENLSREERS